MAPAFVADKPCRAPPAFFPGTLGLRPHLGFDELNSAPLSGKSADAPTCGPLCMTRKADTCSLDPGVPSDS
eukprot:252378-Alexandrium_andersonii.AAC.1